MASYVDLRDSADPAKQRSKRPHMVRFRDHTGKQRAEQFSRKADATARLREVESAEQTGRLDVIDGGKQTLAELGAKFVRLERSAWSAQTLDEHRYLWNGVVLGRGASGYPRAALADMPVRSIRKSHVTEFREDARAAGVPASSVTRALSLITRTLDMAEDDGLINGNPAARVKSPKAEPVGPIVVLTPEQVEALRAKLDRRDAVFVSILAYSGLRPHEALALHAEAFKGDELHLRQAVGRDGRLQPLKAGHEQRDVPICSALARDVAAVEWGTGPMFPNVHGGYRTKTDYDNWRNRRFAKAAEAAKLPDALTPYDLRHSIASLWYRQGIDRATIASRLGHSIAVLERRYLHHFKQLDAAERRTVDQLIAAARRKPPKAS
jgi:integrase